MFINTVQISAEKLINFEQGPISWDET